VVTRLPGYLLAVDPERVDESRFKALARRGRRALRSGDPEGAARLLREALDLWRGPPLPEIDDQAWARAHITHLEEVRAGALEDLLEAELELGHHPEVVDKATEAVEDYPFRERLWGHLMLALYRSERQADALAAYQRARRLLGEELGIEPGGELRRLEEAIVLQKPELDWRGSPHLMVPSHHLPTPLTSFVGRDQELVEIDKLLRGSRLLTLVGPAGSGKSRLALELAGRSMDRFGDGV
jgi:DNA-binding SARP family transcriptional activator